jgi:ubiquinone/menaquinone biosynthesis C-methylase UbiE
MQTAPMPTNPHLDFGYPWWLSNGHLVPAALSIGLLALGYFRGWSKWLMALLGVPALWSISSFCLIRCGFDVNAPGSLPTESFLRTGTGRVLDVGAGTGRSSIMVLQARPSVTLVASDLFGASYNQHFGDDGETPQQRLLANLKAAGVDKRATIEKADMRELPFENASFDAMVSAYAVDHLNRDGIKKALSEAARVVKPGGEFLLMVVNKDKWMMYTFGPLLFHGGTRGEAWWTTQMQEAGFQVVESGTPPATLYLLATRRAPVS